MMLLAQVGSRWGSWSIGEAVIAIVIIAAVIAVAYVALNYFKLTPPPWAVQIFWIVVVAAVAIVAIRFLMSL